VSTYKHDVYVTRDAGSTWTFVAATGAVAVDPNNAAAIWTFDGVSLSASTDYGVTSRPLALPPGLHPVEPGFLVAVDVRAARLLISVSYHVDLARGYALHVTADGGRTWSPAPRQPVGIVPYSLANNQPWLGQVGTDFFGLANTAARVPVLCRWRSRTGKWTNGPPVLSLPPNEAKADQVFASFGYVDVSRRYFAGQVTIARYPSVLAVYDSQAKP
jgi:hypothetical protein